jgi:tetratricopeptide (TPR) repeat protein
MTRRGEKERAEALTEWSRQRRDPLPPDPWLGELLADCYDVQRLTLRFEELVYTGQMEEARPHLQRVAELDSGSWLPHLLQGWTNASAHREAEAVLEYRRALEKSGDPERIVPLLVPCLLALGRNPEAVDAVEAALRLRPDSVALLMLQADLAVQQGDDARTRAVLTALLKKEPYLYKANINLAKILWTQNERAEAVGCLTRIAKAFPADVASRGLLGQYYLETNDAAAAIPPLEQAWPLTAAGSAARERLSAMLGSAYLQVGATRMAAAQPDEAVVFYEKAGRLNPAGMEALAGLAGEWVQTKQFRRAANALTRLAGLQPENPTILISLGDVRYQDGDAVTARVHWEQALKLAAPADTGLRQALTTRLNGSITPDLFQ